MLDQVLPDTFQSDLHLSPSTSTQSNITATELAVLTDAVSHGGLNDSGIGHMLLESPCLQATPPPSSSCLLQCSTEGITSHLAQLDPLPFSPERPR